MCNPIIAKLIDLQTVAKARDGNITELSTDLCGTVDVLPPEYGIKKSISLFVNSNLRFPDPHYQTERNLQSRDVYALYQIWLEMSRSIPQKESVP